MSNAIYSFENQGRRKFCGPGEEDEALASFAGRLGFKDADYKEHKELLLNFILSYHKVICRYRELRNREMVRRVLFTGISLLLLVGVPYFIYKAGTADKSGIATQLTAMLTGLLAVQKSLSSWMDKRKVIGNFWKAESDLKSKLYAFEDKWKGKAAVQEGQAVPAKLRKDFIDELHAAIVDARAVVQDEQNKFFDAITYPSIDIADLLKDAGDKAKALAAANVPPELEQREKKQKAEADRKGKITDQQNKILSFEAVLEQRKELLKKKEAAVTGAAPEEAEVLKAWIKTQNATISQEEEQLAVARGQLEALQKSTV